MNFIRIAKRAHVALLSLIVLGSGATFASAQNQMNVLGGSLTWSTSTEVDPCGNGVFDIMHYTSFQWQYQGTVYPVSGSTAYVYNSPLGQCPANGPGGGVGYTIPSGLGFTPNCAFVFNPTGPSGGGGAGTITTHQCTTVPTPPSGATTFANLQWAGLSQDPTPPPSGATWQMQNGLATGSTCAGTGSGFVTPGHSISGSSTYGSLEVSDTNNGTASCPEWNVLGYLDVDYNPMSLVLSPPTVNLVVDLKFYMPSGINYQALEFDPDLTLLSSNYTYQASIECAFHDSQGAVWKYWDSSVHNWLYFTALGASQNPSCASLSTNTWHHLQLYATVNTTSHNYQFQAFALDGTYLFQSSSSPTNVNACNGSSDAKCKNWATRLWVEQQVDNYSTSTYTNYAYYDYYNLSIW